MQTRHQEVKPEGPSLSCCGEEPVFPGRVQGHVVVKVQTDRRRRDEHTDVIHIVTCLSQIIDDKHLTRRRGETKPGEVKGGKSKTHKKTERDKNC